MPTLAQLLCEARSQLHLLNVVKYGAVASFTYILVDLIDTLEDEATLIWPSKWSTMKFLFLLNRYGPFIDNVLCLTSMFKIDQPNTCRLTWIVTFTWYIIGGWISEIILVMRTIALWNHNRVVIATLVATTILMVVPCLGIAKSFAESIVYPPHEVLEVTRCVPSISDQSGWIFYAGVLFSETAIIILTLLKHGQTSVEGYSLPLLVYTMYRDGTIFYIVLLSLSVANFCCMWLAPAITSSVLQLPFRAIHSTLCSRVIINLRRVAASRLSGSGLAFESFDLSDLHEV